MHKLMSPHGDNDHIGESINIVNNFRIGKTVLNCGLFNNLEKKLIKVLDNLNDSKIYRTDQDGSIMFQIKNNKLKIETCSP